MTMIKTEGLITFTYYDDLDQATEFYQDKLKLPLVEDYSWAKIFKVAENAHIGLVNAKEGSLKPSADKPVMLSIIVDDADLWYQRLMENKVKVNHEPRECESPHIKCFLTWDTEGYTIEILQVLTKPYGK